MSSQDWEPLTYVTQKQAYYETILKLLFNKQVTKKKAAWFSNHGCFKQQKETPEGDMQLIATGTVNPLPPVFLNC